MTTRIRVNGPDERAAAIAASARAIGRGELVVLPTDTVYGLAANAFDAAAVTRLLSAKGRGRSMPPPVLIGDAATVDALTVELPDYARDLIEHLWPGPLTIIARQQVSLRWDLGETRGTVAVRMPDHALARDILKRTGPLAVSSANTTGLPPATNADAAEEMLGERIQLIVDDGPTPGETPSTILDVTSRTPRLLRPGMITVERLDEVLSERDLAVQVED